MPLKDAMKLWDKREHAPQQKPNKINFLNNAVPRDDAEHEENRANIAKLIAMQQ